MNPFEINNNIKEKRKEAISRFKREDKADWENNEFQCNALKYSNTVSEFVDSVDKGIGYIPEIDQTVRSIAAPLSVLAYATSSDLNIESTALDCDKLSFNEIKNLLNDRFDEMDRKLDRRTSPLGEVSKLLSKYFSGVENFGSEMNERFKLVLNTVQSKDIKPIVFSINNFIRYFNKEREKLKGMSQHNYIAKLQEPNSILFYLKDSGIQKEDSLRSALYKLIDKNNNYAIPKTFDDNKAFQALYALLYGTHAYLSIMFFLLDEFSYLADNHYENGNDEEFNRYFDLVETTFNDFKFSLVAGSNEIRDSLLDNVIDTLKSVKEKKFIKHVENELYQDIVNRTEILHSLKHEIHNMKLPLIEDRPENSVQISFVEPVSQTPIGNWVDGSKVRYAVQYEYNSMLSKFSEWSDPFTIERRANPTLKIPVDQKERNRLIFRKFNKEDHELVHIMKDGEISFRDINRDLFNAALHVDEDIAMDEVESLVRIGANISSVFDQGRSVIHAVAYQGNAKVARKFILKDDSIDVNLRDTLGYTPLHIASEAGQSKFIKLLINQGADVNASTDYDILTALHLAARSGFTKTVKMLLNSPNININQKSKNGYTALHAAIAGGSNVIEALLHHKGIDINAKSDVGLTSFHLAAMNGDIQVAQTLVKYKADLNVRDINDMTAMHLVAIDGSLEMMKYLLTLKDKIDINSATLRSNWTPLHFAIQFKNENVALELLEDESIDLNVASHDNITVLHLATATGQANIVKELLNRNINLEEKTDEGYTALHLGAMRKKSEIVKLLIEKGANLEARTAHNLTPLHIAASAGKINTLIELINEGADVSAKTPSGSTSLHFAASSRSTDSVKVLLSKGADIKAVNDNKHLPIHIAILNNDAAIVELFTEHDPSLIDETTENAKLSIQIISNKIVKDIYNYCINAYDETETREEIFENLSTEGNLDIAFIFNAGEEDKNTLKMVIFLILEIMKLCLEEKRKESIKDTGSSADNFKSINSKECLKSLSDHSHRRSITANINESNMLSVRPWKTYNLLNKISNIQSFDRNFPSGRLANYGNNFEEYQYSTNFEQVNVPDTLLLLYVVLTNFFMPKTNLNSNANESKLQAIVGIVDIEERFEELEKYFESLPSDEIYPILEYTDFRNLILTDDPTDTEIMCSFRKTFSELEPRKIEFLSNAYKSTNPKILSSVDTYYEDLRNILENACKN